MNNLVLDNSSCGNHMLQNNLPQLVVA